jgi:ribulose-phosphate 3-epimerase
MDTPFTLELRKTAPHLSVGIMSAPLLRLEESVRVLSEGGARLLHFDVMDGRFCPMLTAGPFFVRGVATKLIKEVHLMVEDPLPLIGQFVSAGADIITLHVESKGHVHRALQCIGEQKNVNDPARTVLKGIAVNPGTPVSALEPFIDMADIIVLLAVNPGFSGQGFIESTGRRFREVKAIAGAVERKPLLEIDGGITASNIGSTALLGPHIIVTGSAVFEGGKTKENLSCMRKSLGKG